MIREIEEIALNTWPALQTQLYDGWILRFAGGYTKRANSISPLYHSSLPLEEKIDYCEDEYRRRNLPVVYKLTDASCPRKIDDALMKRNYERLDETSVRQLEMKPDQFDKPGEIVFEDQFSESWFGDFFACSQLENVNYQRAAKAILNHIGGEVVVVRKMAGGRTVGCGFGAIERGMVGIYDIIISSSERGKGHGRDLMFGILNAALEKGVQTAWLSVVVGNTPAENLYQTLGFQEIYRYWYRKKA